MVEWQVTANTVASLGSVTQGTRAADVVSGVAAVSSADRRAEAVGISRALLAPPDQKGNPTDACKYE